MVRIKPVLVISVCMASVFAITSCGKLNNPSEEFVINCLENVDQITDIEAATEDHDPNKKLNKQGGYTAAVYFRIEDIELKREEETIEWAGEEETFVSYYLEANGDSYDLYLDEDEDPDSPVDVGTDGGGQVEVYATVSDAEARDEYLGALDGSMFSNGSHFVLGTMVIRTSEYLTASQQHDLEDAIVEAFENG